MRITIVKKKRCFVVFLKNNSWITSKKVRISRLHLKFATVSTFANPLQHIALIEKCAKWAEAELNVLVRQVKLN